MNIVDIKDREREFHTIESLSQKLEIGIRAIAVMYDDHSTDKRSQENIFILKENVHYRLFSLVHQYKLFLRETYNSEKYLQEVNEKYPGKMKTIVFGNPFFDKVELEISSTFDNVIFQLSSVFDYISHLIFYICRTNKSDTKYWSSLANTVRGKNNDFSNLDIKETINQIDKDFATHLFDYRALLIHHKKDNHKFYCKFENNKANVSIIASDRTIKYFKLIRNENPEVDIALTFLSTWLIKKSFKYIELLLDALRNEILLNSNFHVNLFNPKTKNGLMSIAVDKRTNTLIPVSDALWEEYKNWTYNKSK